MRLSAKILENINNVNSYKYATEAYLVEGSVNEVHVQLVDLSKTVNSNIKSSTFPDNPLRYLSQAAVLAVSATFPSVDDASVITVAGIQTFADDKSIWKFPLASTQVPSSGSFKITVTEDGNDKSFSIVNSIIVEYADNGGC